MVAKRVCVSSVYPQAYIKQHVIFSSSTTAEATARYLPVDDQPNTIGRLLRRPATGVGAVADHLFGLFCPDAALGDMLEVAVRVRFQIPDGLGGRGHTGFLNVPGNWGVVTGRLVKPDGEPMTGVTIYAGPVAPSRTRRASFASTAWRRA
jgi:hypothetical protein